MSNASSLVNASGTASILPTAYNVTDCILITNDGMEYDMKDLVAEIEIVEGWGQESIDVQLGIRDSIQFLQNALISGNERIKLKIVHTTMKKNQNIKKRFDMDLRIVEIMNFVRPKPGLQIYRLICFNEHMYIDAIKKLIRPFEGSIGQIVSNIIWSDLKIPQKKIGKIHTETKGIIKGIFPRVSPIDAINWLSRNAYDNQTPFFFYDTVAEGIHFTSYASMLDAEVYKNYIQKPFMDSKPGTDEHYKEISEQIVKISSNMNTSQLSNVHAGSYASTLHTLDISSKSYNRFFYDYETVSPQKLNRNRPYNSDSEIDGIKYNKAIDAEHHFISKNTNSFTLDNYHSVVEPTILSAEAIKSNLTTMGHTLTVAGDYGMTPGKKISITIPMSLGQIAKDLKDNFISGNYIVTSIRHSFKNEYTMQLEVQKDSTQLNLDDTPL